MSSRYMRRVRTTAPFVRTFQPFANCWETERLIKVERLRLAGTRSTGRRYYEWRSLGYMEVSA